MKNLRYKHFVEYFYVFDGEKEEDSFMSSKFDNEKDALKRYQLYEISNCNKEYYKQMFSYSNYGDYEIIKDEFYNKAKIRNKRIKKIINEF